MHLHYGHGCYFHVLVKISEAVMDIHIPVFVYMYILFFLIYVKYLELESLVYMVDVCLTLKENTKPLSKILSLCLPSCLKVPASPHLHSQFMLCGFLKIFFKVYPF